MTKDVYLACVSEYESELKKLVRILSNYNITCKEPKFYPNYAKKLWRYYIELLPIPLGIESLKHVRPEKLTNAVIKISSSATINIEQTIKKKDPIDALNFQVSIEATNLIEEQKHYCGFHIDKDIRSTSTLNHPLCHLQYMGVSQWKKHRINDFGISLLLDTPRFVHVPIDIFTGIGYCLANFNLSMYENLILNAEYKNLCTKYQRILWQSYSNSLCNHWPSKKEIFLFDPKRILPTLV